MMVVHIFLADINSFLIFLPLPPPPNISQYWQENSFVWFMGTRSGLCGARVGAGSVPG